MAHIANQKAPVDQNLQAGWVFASSPPDEFASPDQIPPEKDWFPAIVPGTVADALRKLGRFDIDHPSPLEDKDFWYRTIIEGYGDETIRFRGLATITDVFLDNVKILESTSMFVESNVDVSLNGRHELAICFRALGPLLDKPGKRARWRPRMVTPATLRAFRTTFLGHMPGWCPPVHSVGPWRAIERIRKNEDLRIVDCDIRASCEYRNGKLKLRIALSRPTAGNVEIECSGEKTALTQTAPGVHEGELIIENVRLWWPHTHGDPVLHDVTAIVDGKAFPLGRTGFRHIEVDRGADGKGFGLRINGVPVFCRGAVWTTPDLVALPSAREAYEPLLKLARDANMNMLRVGGTMVYEADAFYQLCDELGILVWQDFIFANFDYPHADENFVALVEKEAQQFVARTQASPSIAVLCGGSEIAQQASMMGLPATAWSNRIFDDILANIVSRLRPDAIYLPNTPHGGALPFLPAEGVCHYYGVSAYMRPLEDARHANVRFAAESLGHAHVPDVARIELEPDAPRIVHAQYADRVPGDVGATWFFEDVRNHYLLELYGIDPAKLRVDDPQQFLDLSRAVSSELLENVYALWRREGSPTRGGLVWFLKDLREEAGWGVIDGLRQPKAAWYALRRAFRPVQVLLIDEGLNGLDVHLINEGANEIAAHLSLTCLRDGAVPVMNATREIVLAPRSTMKISAVELWGAFFDTNYAYRFGPPSHDVTIATLSTQSDKTLIAEAFHFPLGRGHERHDVGLQAKLFDDAAGWGLKIAASRFAQSVHVRDASFRPDDNWFHLAPGSQRILRLIPHEQDTFGKPRGLIAAVNGLSSISYGDGA